jgi:hypothetical protein
VTDQWALRTIKSELPALASPGEVAFAGKVHLQNEAEPQAEVPAVATEMKAAEPVSAPEFQLPPNPAQPAGTHPHIRSSASEPKAEVPQPALPVKTEAAEPLKSPEGLARPRSVETMNVTVGGHGEPRADVRITHRNGTVEVSVRTPDPEMAGNLRSGLPELTSALESHGFRSEIRETVGAALREAPGVTEKAARLSEDAEAGAGERRHAHEPNEENRERRQRRPFQWEEDD